MRDSTAELKPIQIIWTSPHRPDTFVEEGWLVEITPEGLYMTTPSQNTKILSPWHQVKEVLFHRD